jgi:hypothetical protein
MIILGARHIKTLVDIKTEKKGRVSQDRLVE